MKKRKKLYTTRVSSELDSIVNKHCKQFHKNRSDVIRTALQKHLRKKKKQKKIELKLKL